MDGETGEDWSWDMDEETGDSTDDWNWDEEEET